MWNTVKSVRQVCRRDLLRRFLLGLILVGFYVGVLGSWYNYELAGVTGSEMFGTVMQTLPMMLASVVMVNTARICGWDLTDKTANYEILYGNKRAAVYFGRFLVALGKNLLFVAVMTALAPAVCTLWSGWGRSLDFSDALVHYALLFPVVFRMVCTAAAITFLVMSDIGGIALSFLLPIVTTLFYLFAKELGGADIPAWIFSASTLTAVEDFSNTTAGFADGAEYLIYKTALDGTRIVQTLVSAFGIGLALLTASFAVYRRRDLN